MKLLNFRIGLMASCQKLGILLENKVIEELTYYQKISSVIHILKWKTNKRDSDKFRIIKMTLKVKFWHYLTPHHYTNSQNSIISFDYSWFLPKNLSSFVFLSLKLLNQYSHNLRCPTCPFLFNHQMHMNVLHPYEFLHFMQRICKFWINWKDKNKLNGKCGNKLLMIDFRTYSSFNKLGYSFC